MQKLRRWMNEGLMGKCDISHLFAYVLMGMLKGVGWYSSYPFLF